MLHSERSAFVPFVITGQVLDLALRTRSHQAWRPNAFSEKIGSPHVNSRAVCCIQHRQRRQPSINFEAPAYVPGTINNQNGWSSTGAAGIGCAVYDHKVVTNAGAPASFGAQSLRVSNARNLRLLGDQTFSRSLVNEAGETLALNGGMYGGVRSNHFEASWSFCFARSEQRN